MAYLIGELKDRIFSLFGRYESENDTNKDLLTTPEFTGKGTQQRFQELCAKEFDAEFRPKYNELYDKTLDIENINVDFLQYWECELGLDFMGVASDDIRKKVIRSSVYLVGKKGTKRGFEVFFNMIGIPNVSIIETFENFTFDDPEATFDDPIRRLDSKCACPKYRIDIDTSTLSVPQIETLTRLTPGIIDFMQPATVELEQAVYYHLSLTHIKNGTVNLMFSGIGDVVIDWGDNVVEVFDMGTGTATHIYTSSSSKTILLTFDDVDNFSELDWQNNCITDLYLADALVNNDVDHTLLLQNNLIDDASALELLLSLLTISDSSKSNNVLINLLVNQLSSPIESGIIDRKYILRDDHDIEVVLGGAFTSGFPRGFNTV